MLDFERNFVVDGFLEATNTLFAIRPVLFRAQFHTLPQAPDECFAHQLGELDISKGANYRELQPAGGLVRYGCQREGLHL